MKTSMFVPVAYIALFLVACTTDERTLVGEAGSADSGTEGSGATDEVVGDGTAEDPGFAEHDGGSANGAGCSGMDILFVIDDSGSMGEEQENLRQNFPRFIEVLEGNQTTTGASLGYKIGVTTIGIQREYTENGKYMTSSFGSVELDDGLLLGQDTLPEPNCGLPEPWLESTSVGLDARFSCMATVGTKGTVVEMPMAVIHEALGNKLSPGGPNDGFYTKGGDTLLVVVIITDEDDCSIADGGKMFVTATGASDCDENKSVGLYQPAQTKEFLDNLTGGEGRYVVVTVAAKEQCKSEFGQADKAKRLKDLIDLCGNNGFFGDICSGDLWLSLKEALDTMQVACTTMPPVV